MAGSACPLAGLPHTIDTSLDELEPQADPRQFFWANRQILFSRASVKALEPHYGNRMLVHLQPAPPEAAVVPKLRVTELRRVSGR